MVKSHTMEWKKRELEELQQLMKKYNVIAVADLTRFPANLFGEIRKKLAGKAKIKVTKTRVAQRALKKSKFKNTGLNDYLEGSIAIIFTNLGPFELYLFLKKNKGKAPAKAGMTAKEDIIVPAGDTGLPPGPDLADLKAANLPVKLKGASIKLSEDKVVVKKGEKVDEATARALSKLDIKPVEVGLEITAAVEGKQLFKAEVLDIDIEETLQKISTAFNNSLNLSVAIAFPNQENIKILLAKTAREAKGVALEAEYVCKETLPLLLSKATAQAKALENKVGLKKTLKPKKQKKKKRKRKKKPEKGKRKKRKKRKKKVKRKPRAKKSKKEEGEKKESKGEKKEGVEPKKREKEGNEKSEEKEPDKKEESKEKTEKKEGEEKKE